MENLPEVEHLISEAAEAGLIDADVIARSLGHLPLDGEQVVDVYRLISGAGAAIFEEPSSSQESPDIQDEMPDGYLARVDRAPAISEKREAYLAELIQCGELAEEVPARKLLMETNQKTVVRVAGQYRGRGLSFGSLVAEGNLGLLKALDTYPAGLGFSLGAFATWEVHRAIRRALDVQTLRTSLPAERVEDLNRMLKVQTELRQKWVREPSVEEIAAEMRLGQDEVLELLRIA
jgi:RNA polymerase sigma factor (sigma-70 family)